MTHATAELIVPSIDHDEAMVLAGAEWDRLLHLLDALDVEEWVRPTDCAGWTVRDMVGHLLGMVELQADPAEQGRQAAAAAAAVAKSGGLRLDALTNLQVREHAHLTVTELRTMLHASVPSALQSRAAMSAERRAAPYDPQLPGESGWTLGYLYDIVHTRDPWLHRIDISRATGRVPELTAGHDGRLIADVVSDWATRHGQPFTLVLNGPAGGAYQQGHDGDHLELDAVEFCRVLSGRAAGAGLLATPVVF